MSREFVVLERGRGIRQAFVKQLPFVRDIRQRRNPLVFCPVSSSVGWPLAVGTRNVWNWGSD